MRRRRAGAAAAAAARARGGAHARARYAETTIFILGPTSTHAPFAREVPGGVPLDSEHCTADLT
jgi:hypothetical protein